MSSECGVYSAMKPDTQAVEYGTARGRARGRCEDGAREIAGGCRGRNAGDAGRLKESEVKNIGQEQLKNEETDGIETGVTGGKPGVIRRD